MIKNNLIKFIIINLITWTKGQTIHDSTSHESLRHGKGYPNDTHDIIIEEVPGSNLSDDGQTCYTASDVTEFSPDPTSHEFTSDRSQQYNVVTYSKCNMCYSGKQPLSYSMVLNFLYLGVGTCQQYWRLGLKGGIPKHMCSVVQYYAQEPCKCPP